MKPSSSSSWPISKLRKFVLAARQRVPARCVVTGAAVIGLLAALTEGSVRFSAMDPHTVASLGFGINPDTQRTVILRACIVLPGVLLPYFRWLRSWRLRSRRASAGSFSA